MKKIAIITGSSRPIPATLGGATQTMMSHLIDVNENEKKVEFIVYSYYEKKARDQSLRYNNTKFRYYQPVDLIDKISLLPSRILRKITFGKTYIRSNFIRWCIKHLKNDKPDVIVIEGNYFQTLQLKKGIKIPLILHMHIDGLNIKTDNAKSILDACNGIIVISEYCKKRVAEIDCNQNNKIKILKNGIDVNHFCSTSENIKFRNEFRKEHNIKESDKVILYCGRIDPVKGVKEAIEAFSNLKDKNSYMIIVGSSAYANSKKDSYIRKIEDIAKKLNDRVIFTGYISQKELPNYYSVADISVVPSKCKEAAGNVIIEALACGNPVVTTKQGGIPEYADNRACLLVDCNEHLVKNLQDAFDKLIENDELYSNKKKYARTIALKYDKCYYYNNFIKTIKDIMMWG